MSDTIKQTQATQPDTAATPGSRPNYSRRRRTAAGAIAGLAVATGIAIAAGGGGSSAEYMTRAQDGDTMSEIAERAAPAVSASVGTEVSPQLVEEHLHEVGDPNDGLDTDPTDGILSDGEPVEARIPLDEIQDR